MTNRSPYVLSLIGLAGMALVALHRWDGVIMLLVVGYALIATTMLAWEARRD